LRWKILVRLHTGGFQDLVLTLFPHVRKKPGFWNQCHKRSLTVQNNDFFFLRLKKVLWNPRDSKKPGFCDASERRVRENVAKFMPKNRLRRTKLLKQENISKFRSNKGTIHEFSEARQVHKKPGFWKNQVLKPPQYPFVSGYLRCCDFWTFPIC